MQRLGDNRGASQDGDERCGGKSLRRLQAAGRGLQRRDVVRIADAARTALHRRSTVVLERRASRKRRGGRGCCASAGMCKPQVAHRPQQNERQRGRGERYEYAATNRQ